MVSSYFFYGTLRDPAVFALVVGQAQNCFRVRDAWLADHRCVCVEGERYPCLIASPGSTVQGIAVDRLDETARARVAFFEGAEYRTTRCRITLDDGQPCEAMVFTGDSLAHTNEAWDFGAWRVREKALALGHIEQWMALFGAYEADDPALDAIWRAITAPRDGSG